MRTNLLRVFAVVIGLTFSVSAVAQDDYRSPAQWSNFYPEESPEGTYISAQEAAQLSVPGGSAEELGACEVRSLPDFTVPTSWLQSSCTPCQQELIEMR